MRTVGPLLEIEHLRVEYPGVIAVNDLSLTVEAGDIYGLIGPNGAGKTTTLRAAAGLQEYTLGTVKIDGFELSKAPYEYKRRLGFMPDFYPVHDQLTVIEFYWITTRVLIACQTERNALKNAWQRYGSPTNAMRCAGSFRAA